MPARLVVSALHWEFAERVVAFADLAALGLVAACSDSAAERAAAVVVCSDSAVGHAAAVAACSDSAVGHAAAVAACSDSAVGHAAVAAARSDSAAGRVAAVVAAFQAWPADPVFPCAPADLAVHKLEQ